MRSPTRDLRDLDPPYGEKSRLGITDQNHSAWFVSTLHENDEDWWSLSAEKAFTNGPQRTGQVTSILLVRRHRLRASDGCGLSIRIRKSRSWHGLFVHWWENEYTWKEEEFFLIRIDVSKNGLGFLRSMPRLKSSCLQQRSVTDDALSVLPELTTVEDVSLMSLRGVGDNTLLVLEHLPRLRELAVSQMDVSDGNLNHLNRRLEYLILFDAPITDDGIRSLQQLSELKSLILTGTQVSDTGLAYLAPLPRLEMLDLGSPAVTESGVATFLKARESERPIRLRAGGIDLED